MAPNNLVLYGLNQLGPYNIGQRVEPVKASGFTTIVMGMLHIGNPAVKSTTQLGDIIFNGDEPLVIRGDERFPLVTDPQQKAECAAWPAQIAALKSGTTSVTKVYASVGGGGWDYVKKMPLVRDFETIQTIYKANGNTFQNSVLEKNFRNFRKLFPAIDGIDMDCEETYDLVSFIPFCEMLIGLGFELTFCPYTEQSFWVKALWSLEQKHLMRYVKWWNLQCYDGGSTNNPDDWAAAIGRVFGQPPAPEYIVPGRAANFWDGRWRGECPADISRDFAAWPKAALAGGFIWEMDAIIDAEHRQAEKPCPNDPSPITLAGYLGALKKGLGLS